MREKHISLHRGFRYRLYPNAAQSEYLMQVAGTCRALWNAALEQRQTWGRSHKINLVSQSRELTALRKVFDWMKAAPRECQDATLIDLDLAFRDFFEGRRRFPRFKSKKAGTSLSFKGREVKVERCQARLSRIWLPKVGWVRVRLHRDFKGEIRNATVRRTALGWEVSIATRQDVAQPEPLASAVGIDCGVAVPLMLSDGTQYSLPNSLEDAEQKTRKAHRDASRKRRGSNRHKKAMRRAVRAKARATHIRQHWQHEVTTEIARHFGHVVMEALQTRNMTRSAKGTAEEPGRNVAQKRGLNRSILNIGWYGLQQKLAYKLEERGGRLSLVNPKNTSRTCAACGVVDAKSRENQAQFTCRHCGHSDNADRNAAINILALSQGGAEIAA